MPHPSDTIADRLQQAYEALTRAERQLATSILENYPVSGLGTITTVAQAAGVSTPTVARMVQKLGYKGFPEFQAELRRELEAKISDPIAKHDTWAERAPDAHILNRFTEAVSGNIRQTLAQMDPDSFDAACALLADTGRGVYVVGGRITRALADYFFLHMQVLRPQVTLIQSISNAWPHYLLEVEAGDVVVILDVRRYENSTLKLAEMAAARGAKIVLFTDQWRSPVSQYADHVFSCRIEVPSAWDSGVTLMLLLETVIAEVQEQTWPETRKRMEALEDMFDRTKFFRKFT
ncbi:DNA-binding transcriptional regulator HexR [Pseudoruegeria aquimaris]|uniref:DNA-binding transcriptional regulator HexR n=1 Tax=Pseudoruegeria aquimaris TaxID=393663 RepID=A0A1Y5RH57_9RHOB|nr:MurR/RpiR family transcriptional regulator [Pseudoruegeria aquimaris]SLN14595.1 DNA-binding transcriptional regulator HexR [Pseudoruegeria aquimaris]